MSLTIRLAATFVEMTDLSVDACASCKRSTACNGGAQHDCLLSQICSLTLTDAVWTLIPSFETEVILSSQLFTGSGDEISMSRKMRARRN